MKKKGKKRDTIVYFWHVKCLHKALKEPQDIPEFTYSLD